MRTLDAKLLSQDRALELQRAVKAAEQRRWRANNPERWQEIVRKGRKKWREKHPEQEREAQRVCKERARRALLALFGNACVQCGFSDWRALQLDHINSDGSGDPHRRWRAHKLKRWVIENPEEAHAKYCLLCGNCNWVKVRESADRPRRYY